MAAVWGMVCLTVVAVVIQAMPDPRRASSQGVLTNYLDRQYNSPETPQAVAGWPNIGRKLGQVAGVDVTPSGDVIIFHRGNRTWTEDTFDKETNVMPESERVPIAEDPVLRLDSVTGRVLDSFGAHRFYEPHGVTVDNNGNLWLTDVGTHQVHRIPRGHTKTDLTMGEKFVPGKDDDHFCKPTDVAVASNGDFFVSDGYCNARVLKFSPTGQLLGKFGMDVRDEDIESPYSLAIPHSLALVEELDLICVADREHQRVLCYSAGLQNSRLGHFNRTIVPGGDIGRVYGLAYDANNKVMHVAALLSEELEYDQQGYPYTPARAFTYDLQGSFLGDWDYITASEAEKGPSIRHDIAVSGDGSEVYLADVLQNTVKKFRTHHRPQKPDSRANMQPPNM